MHSEPLVLHLDKKYPIDPIRLRQGENSLTEIKAKIYSESVPYDLTDCEVTLRYTCPDKSTGVDKVTITDATAGEVTYTLTNKLTSAPGDIRAAYFAITQGEKLVTTQNLGFLILKDVDLNADEAAEYQSYIDELLVQLNELMDECDNAIKRLDGAVKQAKEDIDQYVEESTEKVDQYVEQSTEKVDKYVEESAVKVDKKLAEINDFTTGENLLRGTRDFRKGFENVRRDAYSDGFNNASGWTYYKDFEGFTCVKFGQSGLSTNSAKSLLSSYVPAKKGDRFTIYFEYMVDDVTVFDETTIATIVERSSDSNYPDTKQTALHTSALNGDIESGIWNKAVVHYEISENNTSHFVVLFRLYRNGSVNFRKSCVFAGTINNPIYAPNPNDIDYINDITTSVNLLVGTKDFAVGKTMASTGSYYNDGWRRPNESYYKVIDGFNGEKILNITQTGVSSNSYRQVVSPVFNGIKKDETYTCFFDMMVDDVTTWNVKNIGSLRICKTDSTSALAGVDFTGCIYDIKDRKRVDVKDLVSKKWYRVIAPLTATGTSFEDGKDYAGYMFFTLDQNGSVNFKNVGVYKENIKNPAWSASPIDNPGSSINELDVTALVKPADNRFKIEFATLRQWGKISQLTVQFSCTEAITANTGFKPFTVDASLQPKATALMGADVISGMLSYTGTAWMYALRAHEANQSIYVNTAIYFN